MKNVCKYWWRKTDNTYKVIRLHVDLVEIAPGPRITRKTPDEQRPVVHWNRHPIVRPSSRDRDHTDHYRQPPHLASQKCRERNRRGLAAIWSSREVLQADRRIKRVWRSGLDSVFETCCYCISFSSLLALPPPSRFDRNETWQLEIHPLLAIMISRAVPIRELLSGPPFFEDCTRRSRRRIRKSRRFDFPVACIYALRHRRVTTRTRMFLGAKLGAPGGLDRGWAISIQRGATNTAASPIRSDKCKRESLRCRCRCRSPASWTRQLAMLVGSMYRVMCNSVHVARAHETSRVKARCARGRTRSGLTDRLDSIDTAG